MVAGGVCIQRRQHHTRTVSDSCDRHFGETDTGTKCMTLMGASHTERRVGPLFKTFSGPQNILTRSLFPGLMQWG